MSANMETGTAPVPLHHRSLTTGDWLYHDMSPVDPYTRPSSAPKKAAYEPSSGPAVRDHRMRGYTKHQMFEEHKPATGTGNSESASTTTPSFRKAHAARDVGPQEPVRHAVGRADEFFSDSKATSHYERQYPGGIKALYDQPEKVIEQRNAVREQRKEYSIAMSEIEENKMRRRVGRETEKKKDMELLRSYDPWGKPGAGAPTGKGKLMSGEKQYRELEKKAPSAYVDKVMGRQGAGAPVYGENGEALTKMTVDQETQMGNVYRDNLGPSSEVKYGDKGGRSQYAQELAAQTEEMRQISMVEQAEKLKPTDDAAFFLKNKEGAGAPRRDANGKLITRKKGALSNTRPGKNPEVVQKYAKSLDQQQAELQSRRQQEQQERRGPSESYDPWGKGFGKPIRDKSGKVKGYKRLDLGNEVPTAVHDEFVRESSLVNKLGTSGGGAPTRNAKGDIVTKNAAIDREAERVKVPTDGSDPWGRAGAGAPIRTVSGKLNTRVAGRTENDTSGVTQHRQETNIGEKKRRTAKEQEDFLKVHREAGKCKTAPKGTAADDQYFQWGKGASNPKRDDTGQLVRNPLTTGDMTQMKTDRGGGIGRRQKTDYSEQLAKDLSKQASHKREREVTWAAAEKALERTHVTYAGQWQGQSGPRRLENGEPTGRFGLDTMIHHQELAGDAVRTKPIADRKKYGSELTQLRNQNQERRQQIKREDTMTEQTHLATETKNWGKQGHGAPLRSKSGKVEPKVARLRRKDDTEYRHNAKAARKLD